jgi:hypothetical protein
MQLLFWLTPLLGGVIPNRAGEVSINSSYAAQSRVPGRNCNFAYWTQQNYLTTRFCLGSS